MHCSSINHMPLQDEQRNEKVRHHKKSSVWENFKVASNRLQLHPYFTSIVITS